MRRSPFTLSPDSPLTWHGPSVPPIGWYSPSLPISPGSRTRELRGVGRASSRRRGRGGARGVAAGTGPSCHSVASSGGPEGWMTRGHLRSGRSGEWGAVTRRRAVVTPGPSAARWTARSSAAAVRASSVIGSRASRMNTAAVVSSRSWVRRPWRQFHRRQVTPASSHQTTSPGSGCSTTSLPSATVSNGSVAAGADQPRWSGVAGQVLSTEREQMEDRDRVVQIGQPVHPGQSARGPAQECLQAVAGALRLGAERPVRLPPRGHVRQVLDGLFPRAPARARPPPTGAAPRSPRRSARGPARRQPRAGPGSRAAARTPRLDPGAGEELLERGRRSAHGAPPTSAATRRPARTRPGEKRAGSCSGWRTAWATSPGNATASPTPERDLPGHRLSMRDGALLDLDQFLGAGRVRLADVPVARARGSSPTARPHPAAAVPATSTPRPPASPVHRAAPSPRRVTFTGLGSGGSTSAGSPTPSASLRRSNVPTLGLAAPCSTLTTIRRLTPAASASRSRVQRRDCRSCLTRAPIAAANDAVTSSMRASYCTFGASTARVTRLREPSYAAARRSRPG